MEASLYKIVQKKHRLLICLLLILSLFYFAIPFSLTFFPDFIVKKTIIFDVPMLWIYTFMQLPLTWLLAYIYYHKAKNYDRELQLLKSKERVE